MELWTIVIAVVGSVLVVGTFSFFCGAIAAHLYFQRRLPPEIRVGRPPPTRPQMIPVDPEEQAAQQLSDETYERIRDRFRMEFNLQGKDLEDAVRAVKDNFGEGVTLP